MKVKSIRILRLLCLAIYMMQFVAVRAQPWCRVSSYYDTDINEPIHHIQGILQDKNGMMWLTTWGGLFSFDGKKFTKHNRQTAKDSGGHENFSRGIFPCPTGDSWQMATDKKTVVLTDKNGISWRISLSGKIFYFGVDGKEHEYTEVPNFKGYRGCFVDRQKNVWIICYDSIHKLVFSEYVTKIIDRCSGEPVRCMYRFKNGQYWLCQRRGKTILIYDNKDRFVGYLAPNGIISDDKSSFGAAVYAIAETDDGNILLGTKKKGLFRLIPSEYESYKIEHIIDGKDVYDIAHDKNGRIWLAMLDEGVGYITKNTSTFSKLSNYDYDKFLRVHNLTVYNDTLIVASSEGLIIADISSPESGDITFNYHRYDKNRKTGLGSNLTDFVYVDSKKRLFVCTENAGLNMCTTSSLLDKELSFFHLDSKYGLPDISYCLTELDGRLVMTSLHSLSIIESKEGNEDFRVSCFGPDFFGKRSRFVEIPPIKTVSDKWIVSTDSGAVAIDPKRLKLDPYIPQITLTSLEASDKTSLKYPEIPSEITLMPEQRTFRLEFAALDYNNPDGVYYSYRLLNVQKSWIPLGHDRLVSFMNLPPGNYKLQIRSSNGAGVWGDNMVSIKLNIPPLFIETRWAVLLFIFIGVVLVCAITYTIIYVRNIRRKHNEVISAYLSLIGKKEYAESLITSDIEISDKEDEFVQKLTSYINDNISETDLKIEKMAEHMAVSVSTLIRLTKSTMGITPGDFLAKARIRRAIMYLESNKSMQIAEIAHLCGFSDPKYFSRCFKSEMKMSPSEFKNKHLLS